MNSVVHKMTRRIIGKVITEIGGSIERYGSTFSNDMGYAQVLSRHRPLSAYSVYEPSISTTSLIAPNVSLNGDVFVKSYSSIGYGTVMRAEFSPIR